MRLFLNGPADAAKSPCPSTSETINTIRYIVLLRFHQAPRILFARQTEIYNNILSRIIPSGVVEYTVVRSRKLFATARQSTRRVVRSNYSNGLFRHRRDTSWLLFNFDNISFVFGLHRVNIRNPSEIRPRLQQLYDFLSALLASRWKNEKLYDFVRNGKYEISNCIGVLILGENSKSTLGDVHRRYVYRMILTVYTSVAPP